MASPPIYTIGCPWELHPGDTFKWKTYNLINGEFIEVGTEEHFRVLSQTSKTGDTYTYMTEPIPTVDRTRPKV